ncbi:MAG: hypothetical protein M3442_08220, partial [Chloroflexota bacterium]|nr:hypothetical protein [Chloroflexota bacterium]
MTVGLAPASAPVAAATLEPVAPGVIRPAFRPRLRLLLYLVLAAVAITLGTARLVTGPWFHVYNPRELSLIDGWPVSWESTYYVEHLPTFASSQRPTIGISAVHYRTLLPLFLAAQLYAWTGQVFWSLAAVDLFFWFVAGVAGFHLSLRLGARPWPAALSALLIVASPVLVSHMWRHDLHAADFSGLPIGLWAALVLVDEPRPRWQLSAGLAVLLLMLSLSYQYQWLMVPLAFVLCATQRRVGLRWGAVVLGAALLLFLGATAGSEALFRYGVGEPTAWTGAVVHPSAEILGRLTAARSASEAIGAVLTLAPTPARFTALWGAYHPLVLGAGIAGAALLGRRMLALLVTGVAVSLVSHVVYEAPWTATLCYPLVCIGGGTACATAGDA